MAKGCTCNKPRISPNPRKAGVCNCCSKTLDPAWSSNDENLSSFLDGLEAGMFVPDRFTGKPSVPEWFTDFRTMVESREAWGRDHFGYEYLTRRNLAEAEEEASDGLMYIYLDLLKARRAGDKENVDAALIAASRFAEAYEDIQRLRRHRLAAC